MLQDIVSGVIANLIQYALIILLGLGYIRAGGKLSALSATEKRTNNAIKMVHVLFHNINKLNPELRDDLKQILTVIITSVASTKVSKFKQKHHKPLTHQFPAFWSKHGKTLETFNPEIRSRFYDFEQSTQRFLESVVAAPRVTKDLKTELDHVKGKWLELFNCIYEGTSSELSEIEANKFHELHIYANRSKQVFRAAEEFSPANTLKADGPIFNHI